MRSKTITSRIPSIVCLLIAPIVGIYCTCRASPAFTEQANAQLLSQLVRARTIRIADDWNGYSPVAPVTAHVTLERHAGLFTGQASFSAGGYSNRPGKAIESVAVPIDKIESFLQLLSQSTLEAGAYEPRIEHTDDYPSIRIELDLENQTIVFFTRSQGEGNIPWAVTIRGRDYAINSDVPSKSLQALRPYLKYEVLERLETGVRTSGHVEQIADSVVYIEAGWGLVDASTGKLIYQEMAANRDISGKTLSAGAAASLPLFFEFADGSIEPALTTHPKNAIPVQNRSIGSGLVITSDGFILTSRNAVAAWRASYTWDPARYAAGGVLYVLDARLNPVRREHISYERLPSAWTPSSSKLLDRRRTSGKALDGKLTYLDVSFASTRRRNPGKLSRVSDRYDLAFLKIDVPERLAGIDIADGENDAIKTADEITAIGYPPPSPGSAVDTRDRGVEVKDLPAPSVCFGRVTGLERTRERATDQAPSGKPDVAACYLLSISQTVLGSSGGPILGRAGRVIGIASFVASPNGGVVTVPVSYARELMNIR